MNLEELEKNGLCGLVFDCDGVMIDSADANRRFYALALGALGLPPMRKDQEKFAFQATAKQALLSMVPEELHDKIDETVRDKVDYIRDVLPHIRLMPGFEEFIDFAHKKGFRLAIDTNRTREGIMRVLDFFALPPYFDQIICSSNSEPKPSPDGAEKICKAWSAPPKTVLFVGDSENDRKTAVGAGTVFAALGNRELRGDLEVPDFAAFGQMLQNVPALRC